jgi:hypothetical protein
VEVGWEVEAGAAEEEQLNVTVLVMKSPLPLASSTLGVTSHSPAAGAVVMQLRLAGSEFLAHVLFPEGPR